MRKGVLDFFPRILVQIAATEQTQQALADC